MRSEWVDDVVGNGGVQSKAVLANGVLLLDFLGLDLCDFFVSAVARLLQVNILHEENAEQGVMIPRALQCRPWSRFLWSPPLRERCRSSILAVSILQDSSRRT